MEAFHRVLLHKELMCIAPCHRNCCIYEGCSFSVSVSRVQLPVPSSLRTEEILGIGETELERLAPTLSLMKVSEVGTAN